MINRKHRWDSILSKLMDNIRIISFYLILGIIILIFVFDQILGIWLSGSFFIIYLISYLITHSFKKRLLKSIQEYSIITDKEIANKLERPLDDIRKALYSLSKDQKKRKWLIVFLNKHYIFLNEDGVENFKKLYNQGYNEKKILENLQKIMDIRSRAQVKAIEITLASHDRLTNQKIRFLGGKGNFSYNNISS